MPNLHAAPLLSLALLAAPACTQPAAPDPVAETWTWLKDAPVTSVSSPDDLLCPGSAALDRLIPDINIMKPEGLVRADLAARLSAQLAALPPEERAPIAGFLAQNERLAAEVAFLLGPTDDIPAAYRVLGRLIEGYGTKVADLAPLAAALAAVHDQPRDRRVNENTVHPIDAAELFGYYAANERTMLVSLRDSPAELLVHLADATGSIAELDWARQRYARDKNVGNRYKEITYDSRALKQTDATKRVTEAGGYTLQAIRERGGVCADQAYFAETVGKAIGIPACYVRGKAGEVSHAWVGFIEQSGRRSLRWNFAAGRYDEFEDTQGKVTDPQTWASIPDAYLAIEAYAAALTPEQRQESTALADAARRSGSLAWQSGGEAAITKDLTARQLDLLEAALRRNPGNLEAWVLARNIVASPTSTLAQKERWTQAVDRLAGVSSPDFAVEILTPIFAAEANPAIRANLWDWAAGRFASRPDLAARARLEQARTLVDQGRQSDAAAAARAVFDAYPEAGVVSLESLAMASELLEGLGRGEEVLKMYEQAFRRLRQPRRLASVFLAQTNWFQVGSRYADLLEASGDARKAGEIRRRLDAS